MSPDRDHFTRNSGFIFSTTTVLCRKARHIPIMKITPAITSRTRDPGKVSVCVRIKGIPVAMKAAPIVNFGNLNGGLNIKA
jgi:hypothetical protein